MITEISATVELLCWPEISSALGSFNKTVTKSLELPLCNTSVNISSKLSLCKAYWGHHAERGAAPDAPL